MRTAEVLAKIDTQQLKVQVLHLIMTLLYYESQKHSS